MQKSIANTPKYPHFVKGEIKINPRNKDYRYSLEVPIDENKKENVIVIMMNPSKANENSSDQSVNNVLKYVKDNPEFKNVGTVIILNLIPNYKTDSGNLEIKLNKKNVETIEDYCNKKENDKIILGWGSPGKMTKDKKNEYKRIIEKALDLIESKKVFHVGTLTKKDKYPRHPSRGGWNGKKLERIDK